MPETNSQEKRFIRTHSYLKYGYAGIDSYRRRNVEKVRAKNRVYWAIRRGKIVRPASCQKCGATPNPNRAGHPNIHAHHHHGYAEEFVFDVIFICRPCHWREHHSG